MKYMIPMESQPPEDQQILDKELITKLHTEGGF